MLPRCLVEIPSYEVRRFVDHKVLLSECFLIRRSGFSVYGLSCECDMRNKKTTNHFADTIFVL